MYAVRVGTYYLVWTFRRFPASEFIPVLIGLFGVRNLGAVLGAFLTASGVAAVLGPPLAGLPVDATGGHGGGSGFALAAGALGFLATAPRAPSRSRSPARPTGRRSARSPPTASSSSSSSGTRRKYPRARQSPSNRRLSKIGNASCALVGIARIHDAGSARRNRPRCRRTSGRST